MSLCSDGLSSDPYFLVDFIMSHYLGPDVFSDIPRCSASQRLSKNLPPYTPKHIGSSSLTVAQLQNLYYYVLRNASSTLLLHPDMVLMYLKGYLPMEPSGELHQFTYYFPTNLHPQKRYSPSLEIVKGVVVIDDPALAFISEEELQRFRCLTRLDDLRIDRVVSLSPRPVKLLDDSRGTEQDCLRNGEVTSNETDTNQELEDTSKRKKEEEAVAGDAVCVISDQIPEGLSGDTPQRKETEQECSSKEEAMSNGFVANQDCNSSAELQETCKRKKDEEEEEEESVAAHASCEIISKTPERFRETYKRRRFRNSLTIAKNKNGETLMERDKTDQPTSQSLVIVPPVVKECDAEPAVVTRGTTCRGTSIGVVDIGANEAAYFFQVALPGVSKENGEFSCEIKSDGNVILEGLTTTGQKKIERHSRVFKMNSQKLCPPGPFKLSFNLPGPVDPRFVSPNFRSDGIFEAVVIRLKALSKP